MKRISVLITLLILFLSAEIRMGSCIASPAYSDEYQGIVIRVWFYKRDYVDGRQRDSAEDEDLVKLSGTLEMKDIVIGLWSANGYRSVESNITESFVFKKDGYKEGMTGNGRKYYYRLILLPCYPTYWYLYGLEYNASLVFTESGTGKVIEGWTRGLNPLAERMR